MTVRTWGEMPAFDFTPKDAVDLGSAAGWIDMARGERLSGRGSPTASATWRWPRWRCTGSRSTGWPARDSCRLWLRHELHQNR